MLNIPHPVELSIRSRSVAIIEFSRRGNRSTTKLIEQEPSDMSDKELKGFKELRAILAIPPFKRTKEQLRLVSTYLNTIGFFQQVRVSESDEAVIECAKYLKHYYSLLKTFPIQKEDEPTRFYLILSGRVRLYKKGEKGLSNTKDLGKNEYFGENFYPGLIEYYQASCLGPTHFAVLDSVDLKKIHEHLLYKKFNIVLNFLKTIPTLSGLSRKYIERILSHFRIKDFKRKEFVFKQHEPCDHVYFIEAGEFTISKVSRVSSQSPLRVHNEITEKKVKVNDKLAILAKGEMLGDEDVVFKRTLRSVSCECSSETGKVLMISASDFFIYLARNEEIIDLIKKRIETRETTRESLSKVKTEVLKLRLPKVKLPLSPAFAAKSPERRMLACSGHNTPERLASPPYRIYYKPLKN